MTLSFSFTVKTGLEPMERLAIVGSLVGSKIISCVFPDKYCSSMLRSYILKENLDHGRLRNDSNDLTIGDNGNTVDSLAQDFDNSGQ